MVQKGTSQEAGMIRDSCMEEEDHELELAGTEGLCGAVMQNEVVGTVGTENDLLKHEPRIHFGHIFIHEKIS